MQSEYQVGRGLAGFSRRAAFALVAVTYLGAGLAGWAATVATSAHHPLTRTLWADLVATGVVFAVSMAVRNSTLYDPYWSVAPPVIVAAWVMHAGSLTGRQALVLALVLIWAVRLTANWAVSWPGLGHEDWRYVQIRDQSRGRLPWWLVSLTGIQVMPTIVVLAGLLAVWPAVAADAPLGLLDAVAALVTVAAIATEAVADRQLRRFADDPGNRGRLLDSGLWRYSRHPNYLGEIGFWWGLWLFGLAADPSWWWTVLGPITMVLLFTVVSIPLMDRRSLERRPHYADHIRRTRALLPLPRAGR